MTMTSYYDVPGPYIFKLPGYCRPQPSPWIFPVLTLSWSTDKITGFVIKQLLADTPFVIAADVRATNVVVS